MQADELKAIRKSLAMSQDDFAAAIGLSRVTVGLMERGQAVIAGRTELAVRALLADRQPTDANLSRAVVLSCVDRLRSLLDADSETITLTREEAALTLGVLDGVAETIA